MNRDEITAALIAFERDAPRPLAPWRGIDFWPFIRTWLGVHMNASTPFSGWVARRRPRRLGGAALAAALARLPARYLAWRGDLTRHHGSVLLVSLADRRRTLDGKPFHRLADPLSHFLDELAVPLTLWEYEPDPLRSIDTLPVQAWLALRWRMAADRLRRAPTPDWFDPFADWLAREPVAAPAALRKWSFWRHQFAQILFRARHYEVLLRRLAPRAVFLDCWYGNAALPIVLAAHHCGIPAVDLQHGLQGASHFGYAVWPEEVGPRLLPGTFWVWGERDRAIVERDDNALRALARCVVGGSLELNYFVEQRPDAPGQRATTPNRTVLVTEQKGIELASLIAPAIARSPAPIDWLVRPHPAQPGGTVLEALGPAAARVRLIRPEEESAFESLRRADLHVTGFSSVSLEALAFQIPTILVHPSGREIYRDHLDRGLMRLALDSESLLHELTRDDWPSPAEYRDAACACFAPVETTREALRSLVGVALAG